MNRLQDWLDSLDITLLGLEGYMAEINLKKSEAAWDCDYCDEPEEDVWCAIGGHETPEVVYCICGKCARKEIESGNKGLDQDMMKMKPEPNFPF